MKYWVRNLIVTITLLSVCITSPLSAVTDNRSLGISPLRNELTITPGTSFNGRLTLTNSGQQQVAIGLTAEVFSVTNSAYDYAFNESGRGVDWVTFSQQSVTIASKKSATVSYRVAVPIDAEPGGRYLSLFASSSPENSLDGIVSINRVASLLYITVAGDISRTGSVLTFASPTIMFGDSFWTATLQNSGTAHFHSIYSIQLQSLITRSLVAKTEGDSLILPGTVRVLTQAIPRPQLLGIYKANYSISLGDVPARTETRYIVYAPPLQLLLIFAIIAGIWVLVPKKRKELIK